jgi:hypothetical protein
MKTTWVHENPVLMHLFIAEIGISAPVNIDNEN